MAFDRPIEADRVDDFGLLSSFVRSPLLGPIIWVLEKRLSREGRENIAKSGSTPKDDNIHISSSVGQISSQDLYHGEDHHSSSVVNILTTTDDDLLIGDCITPADEITASQSWRKTSWSDESGQDLVHYFDPQSIHENMRSAPSTVNQPIKSAMKKNACNRNIPKGMNGGYIEYPSGDKQHNSNGKSNGNGYISPQYGWYISTTPPTPNYHAHDKANSSSSHKAESEYADSHEKSELVSKPVFQKTMPNYCGGWPTVPL